MTDSAPTKTAIITGASSGIGRGISLRFAEMGINVVMTYHKNAEGINDTMEQVCARCAQHGTTPPQMLAVQCDVSDKTEIERLIGHTQEHIGDFDILINNAGIQKECPSHEVTLNDFMSVINTNLVGTFLCTQQAILHFLCANKPGHIINISSVHQLISKPGFASYAASKGAIQQLTRTLALEYSDNNIRINSIAPGAIETPINKDWTNDPEKYATVASHIPVNRVGKPRDIAGVAAFLISDDAAYMTGQTLYVDGGLTLYPSFEENWSS